jgi:hypothetical protein
MQSVLKQLVPAPPPLEKAACHLAQRTHDFSRAVWFCQKAAARGQIFGAQVRPARCGDDFNGRPPASNGGGQLKTVHGTRHMDIRENNRDVGSALKNFDGLVSVFRLNDFEAAGSDHINRIHADEKFVLDNQDYRSMVRLGIRQINVSPLHSSIADVIGSPRRRRCQAAMAVIWFTAWVWIID